MFLTGAKIHDARSGRHTIPIPRRDVKLVIPLKMADSKMEMFSEVPRV